MDSNRSSRMMVLVFVLVFLFATTFQGCFSQDAPSKKKSIHPMAVNGFGSSVVFPLTGNVYPLGYYSANVYIGNPSKVYNLDIDTGSDLTWVQCDAPCTGCTMPRDRLYKPKNNVVTCVDPLCSAISSPDNHPCTTPNEQCDYEVEYADNGSCLGVLVKDSFPLKLTNGTAFSPRLTFGCGYDLKNPGPNPPPNTAGVLGLGNGKISIVSQMKALGLTRNVVGHCLSGQGGYLFIGDDLVPSSGIVWTPILRINLKHYLTGPAELFLGGKTTGVKGLQPIFDSGSSYTYLNSQVYQTVVNLVRKDLNGKPLKEVKDGSLPICWKGAKPFKSIRDVKNYFNTFSLSYTSGRNVQLQLPPEAYLIVTKSGNVCLGILDGTEAGLQNFNIIGDISMQDKMVIYDNEKQQIGWVSANCNRLPNVDRDYNEEFSQPYAVNFGILEEHCLATFAC